MYILYVLYKDKRVHYATYVYPNLRSKVGKVKVGFVLYVCLHGGTAQFFPQVTHDVVVE